MEAVFAIIGFGVGFVVAFLIFKSKKENNNLQADSTNFKDDFIKVKAEKDQLIELLDDNKKGLKLLIRRM